MSTEIDTFAGSATANAINSLANGRSTVYSTIQGDDFATKMQVFQATTASVPLAENLNKRIDVVNFVVQSIDMADEETGEVTEVPRTILIDKDGNAYHAISSGVFKSVENIVGILGKPHTWPGALPVKAVKGGSGARQYMTLVPADK